MSAFNIKELFQKKQAPKQAPTSRPQDGVKQQESKRDSQQLLVQAQGLLQRLRVMQPSDTDAFPVLNECTRTVQQLEGEVLLMTDNKEIWRIQLDEMQNDLNGLTQQILSSVNISSSEELPSSRAGRPASPGAAPAAAEDDLFSGLSIMADAPAAPAATSPSYSQSQHPQPLQQQRPPYGAPSQHSTESFYATPSSQQQHRPGTSHPPTATSAHRQQPPGTLAVPGQPSASDITNASSASIGGPHTAAPAQVDSARAATAEPPQQTGASVSAGGPLDAGLFSGMDLPSSSLSLMPGMEDGIMLVSQEAQGEQAAVPHIPAAAEAPAAASSGDILGMLTVDTGSSPQQHAPNAMSSGTAAPAALHASNSQGAALQAHEPPPQFQWQQQLLPQASASSSTSTPSIANAVIHSDSPGLPAAPGGYGATGLKKKKTARVRVGYAKVSDDGEPQEGADLSLLGQQEALHHQGSQSSASSTPKAMQPAGGYPSPFHAEAMMASSSGRQGSLSLHSRKSSSSSVGGPPQAVPADRRDSAAGSSSLAADPAAVLGTAAAFTHVNGSAHVPATAPGMAPTPAAAPELVTNASQQQQAPPPQQQQTQPQQLQRQTTDSQTGVRAPVTTSAVEAFLRNLPGPAAARAEAACAHQEQLMQQLAQQQSDADRRERSLGAERRALLAQCAEASSKVADVEAKQSAAVEVEDFEAAAQLDSELQTLARQEQQLQERLQRLEAQMEDAAAAKKEVAGLQADVLEVICTFLSTVKDEHAAEAAAMAAMTAKALRAAEDEEATAQDTIASMTSHLQAKRQLFAAAAAELEAKVAAVTAPAVAEQSHLQQAHEALGTEVEQLRAQLAAKEQQLQASGAALAEASANIALLSAKYDKLRGSLEADKADIGEAEVQLAAAERQLEDAKAAAAAAQAATQQQQQSSDKQAEHLECLAAERRAAAAAIRVTAAAEAADKERLSQLRATEQAAQDKLASLAKCVEETAAQAKVLTAKRAKLATDRATADERAAAAGGRLPELEADKKAAAAAKDFKEAARLAAEAKTLAATVETLSTDAKSLGEALLALEVKESALDAELAELQAMHQEARREAGLARWLRLQASCAGTRRLLEAAAAGDGYEEADALQAELQLETAEAERLMGVWNFTELERGVAAVGTAAVDSGRRAGTLEDAADADGRDAHCGAAPAGVTAMEAATTSVGAEQAKVVEVSSADAADTEQDSEAIADGVQNEVATAAGSNTTDAAEVGGSEQDSEETTLHKASPTNTSDA